MTEEQYINFDEYIRQGEPQKKARADAWRVAIGLQAVDGLKTSAYLQETARRNIEGDITIDEAKELGEGNTRTTAIFTIKYLRSLGFDVNNDLFEQHSWYFRNALVRANYRNVAKGIDYEPAFLERFFRNLLLGEENALKNRYMMINPPEEWKMPEAEQVGDKNRTTTGKAPDNLPDKLPDKLTPKNQKIISLVMVVRLKEFSIKEMLEHLGLKNRESFMEVYLNPALKEKFVRMRYPDKPHHPRQKYLLTTKGTVLYNEIISSH